MPKPKVAVTFRFPKVLNQNLKAYSVQSDLSQNEIAVRALTGFLKNQGVNVNAVPRFFPRPRSPRHQAQASS